MNTNLRIGDVLKEKGYVTDEQMNQALAYQKEHRDMRVGQILRELGFVTEEQVLDALASRLQLRIVDVAQLPGGCEGRSHGKQRACGKESPASYQRPGASYGAGG